VISKQLIDCAFIPNRGDAMSTLGVARDLSVWLHRFDKTPLALVTLAETELIDRLPQATNPQLTIEEPRLVPVYEAVVFDGITVQPSPAWLARAVTALGCRSINAIVDLTNYLMELYGQPLHAFDLDALLGDSLTLRRSRTAERLTTLDGVERELPAGLLVLQDRDGLVDLVGIMGGFVICVFKLFMNPSLYFTMVAQALKFSDIMTGLVKTIFFGAIIAIVGCHRGFNAKGGAEGVGRATTLSVVISFILIIMADCLFTTIFYFIFKL